ncbi:MAG: hypothetical protein WC156_11660, partial [Pedobacter sp.]
MKLAKIFAFIILHYICFSPYAYCFDDKITHPDITERAITKSYLNNYIVNSLGITEGIEKQITTYLFPTSQTILEWLKKGSKDEDSPTCRAANHFHDPLK